MDDFDPNKVSEELITALQSMGSRLGIMIYEGYSRIVIRMIAMEPTLTKREKRKYIRRIKRMVKQKRKELKKQLRRLKRK